VFVRRLVGGVVVARLEEEVPDLARGHREQPRNQGGDRRLGEQHRVGADETERADKMQRLIDAAVMIVAMVVPALAGECFPKCHAA
jgi:phage tail tape-measure protein